jgi:hypothetical protein
MTTRIAIRPIRVYEVRPRKDKRGVDLISDALPFGRLWYTQPNNAVDMERRKYQRTTTLAKLKNQHRNARASGNLYEICVDHC